MSTSLVGGNGILTLGFHPVNAGLEAEESIRVAVDLVQEARASAAAEAMTAAASACFWRTASFLAKASSSVHGHEL